MVKINELNYYYPSIPDYQYYKKNYYAQIKYYPGKK